MFNHERGALPLRIGLVLAACLLLSGVATPGWAVTDSQCEDQWSESSADDTCSDEEITASGVECTVAAQCTMTGTSPDGDSLTLQVNNSITVHYDQVPFLRNCNGILWLTASC